MPPKRKPIANADGEGDAKRVKVDDETEKANAAAAEQERIEKEKQAERERIEKEKQAAAVAQQQQPKRDSTPPIDPPVVVVAAAAAGGGDDKRPMCRYGANCMRKNPDHFAEYRHPSIVNEIENEHQKMKEAIRKKKEEEEQQQKAAAAAAEEAAKLAAKQKNKKGKKKVDVPPPLPILPPAPPVIAPPAPIPPPPPPAALIPARRSSLHDILKGDAPPTEKKQKDLETYRELLKTFLLSPKISVDQKRMFRDFRRIHDISDSEHSMIIAQLGWSEDEYEDGERKVDDDVDLEEERKYLLDPNGFVIIWIKKSELNKLTKAHENVFSRVCTKFFQTMAKAQANYTISEVGVIVNSKVKAKYDAKKAELKVKGCSQEEWGFHGTGEDAITAISQTGFLSPEAIAKINEAKGKGKSKGKKAPKKIEVLDSGYFGSGIYFSFYSDYAMWYSEERESNQVMLCKLLTGKSFKCEGRMDGKPCLVGYDSHFSPKGNEIVMFDPAGCLPRYIIKFVKQDEQEREQED